MSATQLLKMDGLDGVRRVTNNYVLHNVNVEGAQGHAHCILNTIPLPDDFLGHSNLNMYYLDN
jgi:hypothetical protein